MNSKDYFTILEKNFLSENYLIKKDITLAGYNVEFFAMKGSWELTKLGKVTRFITGTTTDSLSVVEIKKFSKTLTQYILETWKKERSSTFYSKSIYCFPLIVAETAADNVKEWLSSATMEGYWLAFEFPVLFLLDEGQIYYSEKTPTWGRLYYKGIRKFVESSFNV